MRMTRFFSASVALVLSACSNYPSPIDDNFGASVRQMVQSQTVYPDAPTTNSAPATTDGQATKAAVDRYQKSFEIPPLPTNVFNIGVGSGVGGAAAAPR
jgi:starvation-inducible outer membrane lipoprotein